MFKTTTLSKAAAIKLINRLAKSKFKIQSIVQICTVSCFISISSIYILFSFCYDLQQKDMFSTIIVFNLAFTTCLVPTYIDSYRFVSHDASSYVMFRRNSVSSMSCFVYIYASMTCLHFMKQTLFNFDILHIIIIYSSISIMNSFILSISNCLKNRYTSFQKTIGKSIQKNC